jgi:hypothetical protein
MEGQDAQDRSEYVDRKGGKCHDSGRKFRTTQIAPQTDATNTSAGKKTKFRIKFIYARILDDVVSLREQLYAPNRKMSPRITERQKRFLYLL